MGTYCYKITRAKKRKIGGFDIHTPEFVFKSGGSWYDDIDSEFVTLNPLQLAARLPVGLNSVG